ncbi:hypothetical protein EVA_18253 [gut metagenome]|uniref:Uncharacterized protein n=1 Tax=gut metagenome TaxID=749906 RepID=J9FFG1_9ZZZZ
MDEKRTDAGQRFDLRPYWDSDRLSCVYIERMRQIFGAFRFILFGCIWFLI